MRHWIHLPRVSDELREALEKEVYKFNDDIQGVNIIFRKEGED